MKLKAVFIIFIAFLTTSCYESGKIKVVNKVHNVKLENISWGDVSVYKYLLPGESSDEIEITDKKKNFPMINQLEFYMVSNGRRVFLKTKAEYSLDYDETLEIVISDTTKLLNPML